MPKFKDLTGMTFGRLYVLDLTGKVDSDQRLMYKVKCSCGVIKEVTGRSMTSGGVRSCGCLQKESLIKRNTKHNKRYTKEYLTWLDMKKRCNNPKSAHYYNYGGRGIILCEEWDKDFSKFYEYIGEAPTKNHSIDRIDNNKGYEEGNVRWLPRGDQARNLRKRSTNKSGNTGVYLKKRDGRGVGYIAFWTDTKGKIREKYFSLNKYGEELAKFAAIEAREINIERLVIQGVFYGELHGI